jgi:enamine deaminase RidA (YjgF/YER057c/UK114 family)
LLDAARKLQPAGAVYHGMDPADVERILSHPLTMVGSDGLPEDPLPHPRLWGAFPRVLGHYCRERKLFSLETAIHKMTGLSASRFALDERGLIRPGYWADLVLFDAATIHDTPASKHRYSRPRHCRGLGEWHAQLATHAPTGHRAGRFLPRTRDIRTTFPKPPTPNMKETHHEQSETLWHCRWYRWPDHALCPRSTSRRRLAVCIRPTPMVNGEVIEGGIVTQSHQCIQNVMAILKKPVTARNMWCAAACGWTTPATFASFNRVFLQYFGEHPPARACVQASMVIDCKVEVDCIAYKKP